MNTRQKFIGISFLGYLGAAYTCVYIYLNDKLRVEMNNAIKEGNKKQELFEIHERMAGSYEKKTENFEFRNQFLKYRRILISYAKGRVLELGVGTGRSLEFYKDDTSEIIAIDYSNKMLDQAKNKLDDREEHRILPNTNIKLIKMDCEDIVKHFGENSFDSVVDINNFHSYNDYEKVYSNIKQVLKNDGILLFLARGESDFFFLRDFYRFFKPFIFMKLGQDLSTNWTNLIENDKDWEILYKKRKNYGRTYIYILKLKKNNNINKI